MFSNLVRIYFYAPFFEDCIGIKENIFSQDVNIYPNPSTRMFNVEIQNAKFALKISIIDPQGEKYIRLQIRTSVQNTKNKLIWKALQRNLLY